MTRIFGYTSSPENPYIQTAIESTISNLQESVEVTYQIGRHAYGLGFIVIDKDLAIPYSVFKGYRGINSKNQVKELMPKSLNNILKTNPVALFAVLQQDFDHGSEEFTMTEQDWSFPLVSENWLAITMGWWGDNETFIDTHLPWYDKNRPSNSITRYLETNPNQTNFDWVDSKRTPIIIAANKASGCLYITDRYTGQNDKNIRFATETMNNTVLYQGVRDIKGNQV